MARPKAESPTYDLAPKPGRGPTLYITWRENGRTKRVSTRTAIESEAKQFKNDWLAGRNAPAPIPEPSIRDIFEAYKAARDGKVKEHKNLVYAGNALLPIIGDMSPSALTEERVENYTKVRRHQRVIDQKAMREKREARYNKSTAKGYKPNPPKEIEDKPLSNATLVRDLGLLRAALTWAVDNNWLVKAPKIKMPTAPKARDRWLTRDEYALLVASAVEPHMRLFIIMALNTGARKSAILELTWKPVDPKKRGVDLKERRIDFGEGYANKYRSRHVAINSTLLAELKKAAHLATSDYVIEYAGENIKDVKTGFQAACRRAGLKGVSPHTMRHTAASWMVQAGISYVQVGKFLGNSAQVVEEVYGHHAPDHLRDAAEALVA
jgi:integrase